MAWDEDDDRSYKVVINHEEQYSIWPADRENALGWSDVDLTKRQLCVQRSDWHGHVDIPKGGRLRYVPMTVRLGAALREHRHLRSPRVVCQRDGSSRRSRAGRASLPRPQGLQHVERLLHPSIARGGARPLAARRDAARG